MTNINIQRDVLKAVSRFMAKQDIRYYLNGVLVEVYRNVAYLVATDGHRLAAARLERPDGETWEPGEVIIPGECIAAALKSGNVAERRLPLVLTVDGERFEFDACGKVTAGKVVEGKFPDWRKVIPGKVSGEVAHFNAEYLIDCHKAAADLGSKFSPPIGHNGDGAALIVLRQDVLAVVMPMRGADRPEESPEWVSEDSENLGRVLDVEAAHGEALAEELERAWDEALAEYAARELSGNVYAIAA